jgi:hypothetical protein
MRTVPQRTALGVVMAGGQFSIENLPQRRGLRVVSPSGVSEVHFARFPTHEGIALADAVSDRCYVLLAGTETLEGSGAGDFAAAFAREWDARGAFRYLRVAPEYRGGWAELAEIDGSSRLRPLCWFGHRTPLTASGSVAPDSTAATSRRRRRGRLSRRRSGRPASRQASSRGRVRERDTQRDRSAEGPGRHCGGRRLPPHRHRRHGPHVESAGPAPGQVMRNPLVSAALGHERVSTVRRS